MINKVILVGNLGQDPEIRYAQSGGKIATFSLATSEFWKDKSTGERKSLTQWHRVVVFNENLANVVEQYAKKGSKLYIEGSLQNRKYTGNDGVEKNITEIVLSQYRGELQLLDSRGGSSDSNFSSDGDSNSYSASSSSGKASSASSKKAISSNIGDDLDDEIPF
jgi:single-strand DNA-binding protein